MNNPSSLPLLFAFETSWSAAENRNSPIAENPPGANAAVPTNLRSVRFSPGTGELGQFPTVYPGTESRPGDEFGGCSRWREQDGGAAAVGEVAVAGEICAGRALVAATDAFDVAG